MSDEEGFRGPPVKITIVDSTRKAQRLAFDLKGRFSNFKPILSARGPVRKLVDEAVLRNFDTEGEYSGKRWEKLARTTLDYKAAAGKGGNNILVFEGALREFVAKKTDRRKFVDFDEKSMKITWDYPVMGYHQRGHNIGDGDIGAKTFLPKRPIVPEVFPQSFLDEVKKRVQGYVVRGVIK